MLKKGIAICLVGAMALSLLSTIQCTQNAAADGDGYIPGYNILVTSYTRQPAGEDFIYPGWVREFSPDGSYEEVFSDSENGPSDAHRLANGNTLVALSIGTTPRIEEISPDGQSIWSYSNGPAGRLKAPVRAERLGNGNTLISDLRANRVVEIDYDGNQVWQMAEGLIGPMDAMRLSNGNTLIVDMGNDRIIEVNGDCAVINTWSQSAIAVDVSSGGNLLIGKVADTKDVQVCEIDSSGNVLWEIYGWGYQTHSYGVSYLENGNYLVSSQAMIYEIDALQQTVWSLDAGGCVYSLEPLGSNDPPVASISGGDRTLITSEAATFDGSGSEDSDGTIDSCEWDWGDGSPAGTTETADHSWSEAGTYTVTLTVTDDDGATGDATVTVTVVEPAAAIDDAIGQVEDLGLPAKVEEALVGALQDAVDNLDSGDWKNAEKDLDAFVEDVLDQVEDGVLTEAQAEALIAMAGAVADSVNAAIDASIAETEDASALVDGMGLDGKTEKGLLDTLDAAIGKLSDGKLDKAAKKLQSFIDEVDAKLGKGKLTEAQAAKLTAAAEAILEGIP